MSSLQNSYGGGSGGSDANGKHIPKANSSLDDTASEQTPLLSSHNNGDNVPATVRGGADADVERGPVTSSSLPRQPSATTERLCRWNKGYSRAAQVIGILLLLCLFVVAASSWVAQRVLDRAMVLEIQKTDIRDMDESGFQASIRSTIYLDPANDGFFGLTGVIQRVFQPTMTIKPTMLTLSIPNMEDDIHMAEFQVEEQHMQVGQVLQLDISAHVRVTNATLMAKFFGQTLEQSTVDLAIRGPLVTRLGSLWYMNLRINRSVPMEGLKGIQNATLVSMELPDNHPLGGISMSGVARINNPSKAISMHMGPVTFGIYLPSIGHPADSYKIAEATSPDLHLEAGKANEATLTGRLFHLDDWTLNEKRQIDYVNSEKKLLLGQFLSRFIQGDNSVIQVRALSKDPDMPLWLREAFKTIALEMLFPGSPTKDFIRSLMMNELGIGFSDNDNSPLLDGRMSSVLQLPPNVTFPIKLLSMKPNAWLKLPRGDKMASLVIPNFQPTTSRQDGTTLEVDLVLDKTPLEVVPEVLPDFFQFLNATFNKDWVDLGIEGNASAVVETALGTFELGPIPFDVVTRQRGLDGLTSAPPLLQEMDVVETTERSLTIKATLVLSNPSNISAALGDLRFLWSFDGRFIGLATVPNAIIQPGNNTVECIGIVDPSTDCTHRHDPKCDPELAKKATREFISKYISGDNTTMIDIVGYPDSTRIPLLRPIISSFLLSTRLPTIDQDFLISSTMFLFSRSIVLELQNPLNTVISILYINGTASYKGHPLGHILADFEHNIAGPKPILIPANDHKNDTSGYAKTPRMPVSFDLSSIGYEVLKKALGGSLDVDIVCHIKTKVGSMLMWVDFVKDGVNTRVRKGF
ncbi:hypothetical protein BGZ65_011603 [Modicella reniformis]|uniref:Tag1-like fifth Ig-like domain-containing protein n=1 Tax=Modicella reniformis TaxID=1440133 RepID=A0A9P6J6N9_9FUNG|nr:hypothetical protein BGZ65_011603 [Modicella reniformis]